MEKKTQVYIKQIALKDYKCFKGENVFSFVHNTDDGKFQAYQWTVLLGNNGTGKTNLLKAIANMEPVKADYTNQPDIKNLYIDMAVGLGDKTISKERAPPLCPARPCRSPLTIGCRPVPRWWASAR